MSFPKDTDNVGRKKLAQTDLPELASWPLSLHPAVPSAALPGPLLHGSHHAAAEAVAVATVSDDAQ